MTFVLSRFLPLVFVACLLLLTIANVETVFSTSRDRIHQNTKENMLPLWFRLLFFPIFYFCVITLGIYFIIRRKLEDLGLNLHLTAFVQATTTLGQEHPYAQELTLPVFLIITMPLILTFALYALQSKKTADSKTRYDYGCLFLGMFFLGVSMVWAVSFFLRLNGI